MKAQERPLSDELLAAYLEGEVTTHEAAQIERALAACSANRRHLQELRRIRNALTAATPEVDDLDLVAAVRNQAQKPATIRTPKRSPVFAALAAVAGIAAMSLGVALSQRDVASAPDSAGFGRALERSHEFRAKAASSTAAEERWTGIRIYRVVPNQAPERVTESLDRRDALLFSYTNLGSEPFEHLMIYGIGDDQRVYWFYPAYEAASENPRSIDINPGNALLADAVEHDYSARRLEVYALFSHQPLHVSQVEASGTAPIPGTSVRRISLRVRP